jgi:hypothetical protein
MTLPAEVEALIGRGPVAHRIARHIAENPGLSYRELAEAVGTTVRGISSTLQALNFKLGESGWVFRGCTSKGTRLLFEGDETGKPRRRLTCCIPPDMRPKRRRLTATPPGWPNNPDPAGNPGSLPVELGRGLSAAPAFSGDRTTGERA